MSTITSQESKAGGAPIVLQKIEARLMADIRRLEGLRAELKRVVHARISDDLEKLAVSTLKNLVAVKRIRLEVAE